LSECRLLMKLRRETKAWTQQKEWNQKSELIVHFWRPAAFWCRVPLFLVGPCPHRDRDYHIGSNFWKFYLITTGFTLRE
jgi:hypothetical protein